MTAWSTDLYIKYSLANQYSKFKHLQFHNHFMISNYIIPQTADTVKHTAYLWRTWSKCSLSCAQCREMLPYMTVSSAVLTNTARGRTWWIPVNCQATGKTNIEKQELYTVTLCQSHLDGLSSAVHGFYPTMWELSRHAFSAPPLILKLELKEHSQVLFCCVICDCCKLMCVLM